RHAAHWQPSMLPFVARLMMMHEWEPPKDVGLNACGLAALRTRRRACYWLREILRQSAKHFVRTRNRPTMRRVRPHLPARQRADSARRFPRCELRRNPLSSRLTKLFLISTCNASRILRWLDNDHREARRFDDVLRHRHGRVRTRARQGP